MPNIKVSAEVEAEESILRNTFINAQVGPPPQRQSAVVTRKEPIVIKWVDQTDRKQALAIEGPLTGSAAKKNTAMKPCIKTPKIVAAL